MWHCQWGSSFQSITVPSSSGSISPGQTLLLQSFKTSGTTHPVTHCYIPEDMHLQQHYENLTPHKNLLVIQIRCLLGTCCSQSTHWSIQCVLPCTMTEHFLEWNLSQQNRQIPKNPSLHILCKLLGSQCTGNKEQIIIMLLIVAEVFCTCTNMQANMTHMNAHTQNLWLQVQKCFVVNAQIFTKWIEIWELVGMCQICGPRK
jgi:hypothetical protein